ncbi:MAG TPA: aspartyl protease family protein [Candidatus Baltobacteraceae bacterium]
MLTQPCDPVAIYQQAFVAAGGARWHAIRQIAADGSVSQDAQTGSIHVVVDTKTGRSVRMDDVGGRTTVYVNDGKVVWYRDFSGGVHPLDSRNAEMAAVTAAYIARQAYFDPAPGATMRCLGRTIVGGASADVIAVTPKGGLEFQQDVDSVSHLIVRTIRQTPTDTLYTDWSDFRTVSGVALPFSIAERSASGDAETQRIRRYALSPTLDAKFARPAALPNAGFAGEARQTTIPLRVERGDAVIEAFVNGRGPLPFLLDTGGHFILTLQTARKLGLTLSGAGASGGGGSGRAQTSYALVDDLQIGTAYLRRQPVVVIDYDNDFSDRGKRVPLAGILGLEVFERFATTLDYGSRSLTLTDFSAFAPPAGAACLPISFQEDMPLGNAAVDGVEGLFGIDTGNSGTPILFGPFLQRTGLLRFYGAGKATVGHGTGGAVSMLSQTLRKMSFDSLTFSKLPVTFVVGQRGGSFSSTTEAGNIGYFVLSHFVPTFDYGRGVLYLQRASHVPLPVYNRAGLTLEKSAHDVIAVDGVTPNGPAAQAGMRPGDEILAIDGVAASDLGVGDIYAIVRGGAGTVLRLTVRRKNVTWKTSVTLRILHPAPTVGRTEARTPIAFRSTCATAPFRI